MNSYFIVNLMNTILYVSYKGNYKLVYSGDCMPSEKLIKRGRDCDLLIHEATFEDSRSAQAQAQAHSTMSQAIRVGIDMNAKHVILTHFRAYLSYKSDLLYKLNHRNVLIANDFMRVNPLVVKNLNLILPGLKLINPISENSTRADLFK